MSHELNLFLNKRDPAFFKSVVVPILSFKMEKQIVDLYLLRYFEQVNAFVEYKRFTRLNAMEKCLLIDSLMKSGQAQKAVQIANLMRDSASSQK